MKGEGYSATHSFLLRNFPKAGTCDECGKSGYTEHAFLYHPDRHTRDRADYRELCKSCHELLDKGGKGNWHTGQTHCKRGHEFTPENTSITSKGSRQCNACRRFLYHARKATQCVS